MNSHCEGAYASRWVSLRLSAQVVALGVVLAQLSGCQTGPASDEPRALGATERTLDSGWIFYRYAKDESFDIRHLPAEGWVAAVLPHTARLEPRIVNDQWQGDALYRRTLFVASEHAGKSIRLRFEGAMMVARVYLNGELVTVHQGGYLPFTIDLSDRLRFGEDNDLLVHLDNRDNPLTGPKPLTMLDFNMYGGLYREVRLIIADPLHITDEMQAAKAASGGIFVTYPKVSHERAMVSVKTHIANSGEDNRRFRVRHTLRDGGSDVVSVTSGPMALRSSADVEDVAALTVEAPKLWSPQAPHLYTLVTELIGEGEIIDRRTTRIGIRRIAFDDGRFTINGKPIFLRGVNRHQEYPYVGYALSPQADYRDAKLIKEAGFDYVRLSHYPHSRHFMQAADEQGLVVLNAILGWQYYNPDPRFSEHVVQTCRDLIRRDRNHPSVIAWECSLNESPMPLALVERLHAVVHEEYPGDQAYSAGWTREGYDIFLQARQHRLLHYEAPDRPYLVSEYGDWEYYAQNAGLNQDAWADLSEAARSSRQLLGSGERRLLQQATNIQEAHNDNLGTPAFADGYWVMFDYNRGYADDLEASGIMSLERVAKPAYHFFRSQRDAAERSGESSAGHVLVIASNWNADSDSEVRVFSNAEEVELRLNGKSLGRRPPDRGSMADRLAHPPFSFSAGSFQRGRLEAVAYVRDRPVTQAAVTTPGRVSRLSLTLATEGIPVGRNDLVFLRASLRDDGGTLVPVNGVSVEFGLGCPDEVAGFAGPSVMETEAGIASVLLRISDPHAHCLVSASSGKLAQAISLPSP